MKIQCDDMEGFRTVACVPYIRDMCELLLLHSMRSTVTEESTVFYGSTEEKDKLKQRDSGKAFQRR